MNEPLIIFVMGVSGSGKSTIGRLLADALTYPFYDGDDFHPEANIKKMSNGEPLNDTDRKGWLESLNTIAVQNKGEGAVIVCSALKNTYRNILIQNLQDNYRFVYLEGSIQEIRERLAGREGHFMPEALLQSQFDTLEVPKDAINVPIKNTPEAIITTILKELKKHP